MHMYSCKRSKTLKNSLVLPRRQLIWEQGAFWGCVCNIAYSKIQSDVGNFSNPNNAHCSQSKYNPLATRQHLSHPKHIWHQRKLNILGNSESVWIYDETVATKHSNQNEQQQHKCKLSYINWIYRCSHKICTELNLHVECLLNSEIPVSFHGYFEYA